jgi:ribosomal protein L18
MRRGIASRRGAARTPLFHPCISRRAARIRRARRRRVSTRRKCEKRHPTMIFFAPKRRLHAQLRARESGVDVVSELFLRCIARHAESRDARTIRTSKCNAPAIITGR